MIDKKRNENNYPTVMQKARHITTAGKKGLGAYDKNNIDFIELTV